MANMIDYVYWRGDLTFDLCEFNTIDNIILCNLTYLSFNNVVCGEKVTLRKALSESLKTVNNEKIGLGVLLPSDIFVLARAVMKAKRYANITVSDYIEDIDYSVEKQFRAITYHIDKDRMFLCYSGTDDTLVGWKENFNILILPVMPSEEDALKYCKEVMEKYPDKKCYLGGHSKGGHLAMYAGINLSAEYIDRVINIYNNDGQGFLNLPETNLIENKVINTFPEDSIVGMLLTHVGKIEVVKSDSAGFFEHDAFSWQVIGSDYIHVKEVSEASKIVSQGMLDITTKEYSKKELTFIIKDIFETLHFNDKYTLTDLINEKTKLIFRYFKLDNESRVLLRNMLGLIRRSKIYNKPQSTK